MDNKLKELQRKVAADLNDYNSVVRLAKALERIHVREKIWKHIKIDEYVSFHKNHPNDGIVKQIKELELEGWTIFSTFCKKNEHHIIAYRYEIPKKTADLTGFVFPSYYGGGSPIFIYYDGVKDGLPVFSNKEKLESFFEKYKQGFYYGYDEISEIKNSEDFLYRCSYQMDIVLEPSINEKDEVQYSEIIKRLIDN